MRTAMKTLSALACLALAALSRPPDAHAQAAPDPFWSGDAPNAWLYASPTAPPVPVRVGPTGARSEQVTHTSPGFFEVLLSIGAPIGVAGASPHAILVNRIRGSAPVPAHGPPVVTTGFGPAAFSEVGGSFVGPGGVSPTPYVGLRPGAGSYSRSPTIVFETLSLEPVDSVRVRVLHAGAWIQTVDAERGALRPLPQGFSEVYWFVTVGAATYTGTVSYEVRVPLGVDSDGDGLEDTFLDSDGDGVPDGIELDYDGHPGEADLGADRDKDGMSDFDEWLRGSDPDCAPPTPAGAMTPCLPLDTDSDGWSDWDEDARYTNAVDDTCLPSVSGLLDAEVIVENPIHDATLGEDQLVAKVGGLDIVGLDWTARDVRNEEGCAPPFPMGPTPTGNSDKRKVGGLFLRASAASDNVIRTTGPIWDIADQELASADWVGLAFVPRAEPATPLNVLARMTPSAIADPEAFRDAYQVAFAQVVKSPWDGRVGPRALLPASLLTDLVSWRAGLGDGQRPVLGLAGGAAPEAMVALRQHVGSMSAFVAALDGLFDPGGPLAAEGAVLLSHLTDQSAGPIDRSYRTSELGRYLARLFDVSGFEVVGKLTPAQRTLAFDPAADYDLDGLASSAELIARGTPPEPVVFSAATDPLIADSDGDGANDASDPCPNDALDGCLARAAAQADSDGDGVVDALDNCLNIGNRSQADSDGDGLGDACSGLAYIVTPRVHPVLRTGTTLRFSSQLGALGKTSQNVNYRWNFGGLAPDSTQAQPAELFLARPGTYRVELWVGATGVPQALHDFRDVTVIGPEVALEVAIEVTGNLTEGVNLTFKGYASSPVGTLSPIQWDMGDGTQLSGATVRHRYAQQGPKTVTASVSDSVGLTGSVSLVLEIKDTLPTARIDSLVDGLAVTLTDTSTAYDGIAGRTWDLGDGSPPRTDASFTHTYQAAGRYTITLTVVDGDGSTKTATRKVIADGMTIQRLAIEIDDGWQIVAMPIAMIDPIVIAGVVDPSLAGTSGVVRVRNVGPDGFEARFEAWPPLGPHGAPLAVDVLAVERGTHGFSDGSRWQADSLPLEGANADFVVEPFESDSAALPVLLLTGVQSANDPAPVGVRVRTITATDFEVALMQREADAALARAEEEVGFLAIWGPQKKGSAIINGAASAWTSVYTKLGTTPKTWGNCTLVLAEETSLDAETAHVAEYIWLLRTLSGCWASVMSTLQPDPVVIERR